MSLASGFKNNKESPSDVTLAFTEMEVTTLKTSSTIESTFVGVDGFERYSWGLEFSSSWHQLKSIQ